MSYYEVAKKCFVDEINPANYIELPGSQKAYEELEMFFDKPFKLILLYGEPGTGKSLLLSRILDKKKYQKEIHYLDSPLLEEEEFFRKLFNILIQKPMPKNTKVDFNTFVDFCKAIKGQREIIILLDEAQLYPKKILEQIRILSDTGVLKFVISLHKTTDEEVIAKTHFQTRIWGTIELKNATKDELKAYIQQKLIKFNQFEIANQIKKKHIDFIYKVTKGNFRDCSKLMYTTFEIYQYYEKHDPSQFNRNKFSQKFLEMAAIAIGAIDV
jgi:type II secretory pathway predicted ATPase ExeA